MSIICWRRKSMHDAMRGEESIEVRNLALKHIRSGNPDVIRRCERRFPSVNESAVQLIVVLEIRQGAVVGASP
jgi:hypothetical protein